MSLEETLREVATLLRDDLEGAKEMQVRSTVIDPVLRALDWNTSDLKAVRVEYTVNNGSVDYALLNNKYNKKPLVFIEAKKVGALNAESESQLFRYANNQGIPLLILTDGNIWDFYLSMAEGPPKERRFHQLELSLEDRIADHVNFLENYLRRNCVVSGHARHGAEKMLAANREREEAYATIPEAYRALLHKPDDMLCDLLAHAVENVCGTQPNLDDVKTFLTQRALPAAPKLHSATWFSEDFKKKGSKPKSSHHELQKLGGFVFDGKTVKAKTNIQVLIELVKTFHQRDPEFMKRFFSETVSKRRRLVAQNPDDLYDSESLKGKHRVNLENGWWLGTNISKKQVVRFVKTACKVAHVEFDVDLKLINHE